MLGKDAVANMAFATLTSKGQATIPLEVRTAARLKTGARATEVTDRTYNIRWPGRKSRGYRQEACGSAKSGRQSNPTSAARYHCRLPVSLLWAGRGERRGWGSRCTQSDSGRGVLALRSCEA